MIRASALNLSRVCGHASRLSAEHPERSVYSALGDAFHAGAAAYDAPGFSKDMARDVYDKCLRALDPDKRKDVMAMVTRWIAWRKPNLPETGILVEQEIAIDPEGMLCDAQTPGALVGHVDLMWKEDHRDIGGGVVARVLDHKTGLQLHTPHPDDNLQLQAYGIGALQLLEAEHYQVGLCYHDPAEEPRVVWGRPSGDADAAWVEVRAAASKDDIPVTGPHCHGCFTRTHCKAWMLPAMESGPDALVPFTAKGALTQDTALAALNLLKAWEDIGRKARARLEDFARDTPIVHGNQQWGPSMRKGRTSVDVTAAKKMGLYEDLSRAGCIKTGDEYEVFQWRARR